MKTPPPHKEAELLTTSLSIGAECVFTYPSEFRLYPDYKEHSGQSVKIIHELVDGIDFGPMDNPERMFRVVAEDGWQGDVWEDELKLDGDPTL